MYYEDVFKALNRAKVDYLVAGGIAVILHGYVRFTIDLDLFVNLEEKNLITFAKAMTRLGYRPKVPVKAKDFAKEENRKKWIKEKDMKVFSFYHTEDILKIVDIFMKEFINYKNAKRKSKIMKAGRINIPVISVDDLIKLKKAAKRPKDFIDIEKLKELKGVKR